MAEESVATLEGQAAATPVPSAVTATSPNATGSNTTTKAEDRAPAARDRSAFERRVFDGLEEGLSPNEARKRASDPEPKPTAPATREADAERGTAHQSAVATATGKENRPPDKSVDDARTLGGNTADFEGLDAKGKQALSQTHLLPDPAVWEMMDLTTRANLLAASRDLLRTRSRDFQREQAKNGTPKNGEVARDEAGRFATQTTPDKGVNGEQRQGRRATDAPANANAAAARAAGDRSAPLAGTSPGDVPGTTEAARALSIQLPPEAVKQLTEQYGEEGAKPILDVLAAQQKAFNDQLAQMTQAAATHAETANAAMRATITAEERNARAALASELPRLASDDAAWQTVRNNAKVLAQAAYSAGQDWSWQDCLEQAGVALFHKDIQQEAQRGLAQNRQKSLRATPERGNEQARPANAMTVDDWEAVALEALDSGKSPEEIRAMRTAGAVA